MTSSILVYIHFSSSIIIIFNNENKIEKKPYFVLNLVGYAIVFRLRSYFWKNLVILNWQFFRSEFRSNLAFL